jgi:hypothetical protein
MDMQCVINTLLCADPPKLAGIDNNKVRVGEGYGPSFEDVDGEVW